MTSQCHNCPPSPSPRRHLIQRDRPGKFLVRLTCHSHLCPAPAPRQTTTVSLQPSVQRQTSSDNLYFSVIMSTESLNSSATSSSFTGDIDSYLDKIGSKAPQSWRKPRSRIYDYNRTLGYEYYQVIRGGGFKLMINVTSVDNLKQK